MESPNTSPSNQDLSTTQHSGQAAAQRCSTVIDRPSYEPKQVEMILAAFIGGMARWMMSGDAMYLAFCDAEDALVKMGMDPQEAKRLRQNAQRSLPEIKNPLQLSGMFQDKIAN